MSQFTVNEVLAGSRRIDEMKREVEGLIKMCVGIIHAHDMRSDIWPVAPDYKRAREVDCGEDLRWEIVMSRGGGHGPYIEHIRWYGDGFITTFPIEGRAEWIDATPFKIVRIHTTLQFLLDYLLTSFPELEEALQPFRVALK